MRWRIDRNVAGCYRVCWRPWWWPVWRVACGSVYAVDGTPMGQRIYFDTLDEARGYVAQQQQFAAERRRFRRWRRVNGS